MQLLARAPADQRRRAVVGRVANDLSAKGVTEGAIRAQMTELMAKAIVQVKAGV